MKIANSLEEEYHDTSIFYFVAYMLGYINEFMVSPLWTRDYVQRLKYDNIKVSNEKGFKELGIKDLDMFDETLDYNIAKWKRVGDYFMDVNKKKADRKFTPRFMPSNK